MTLKDVTPQKFIAAYAAHLKKGGKIQLPAYVDIVKTGHQRELAPLDSDWYYTRCAAVARQLYLKPRGVGSLRKIFGKKKNYGSAPEHRSQGAGGIIRSTLQQLENLGIVEKNAKGGRIITSFGRQEIDKVANSVLGARSG
mmetsp:Transcript_9255/g.34234  ORF Transcript_9255/g.34234 Transcript_9255/m.34234 type:complete len:141 (-) Transcript_9255:49-471(-)